MRGVSTVGLLAAALLCGAVAPGCGGDGANGEKNLVRFSLIVDYPETDGFESPVAAGSTLLVALQHPDPIPINPQTYSELTLEVDTRSGEDAVVFPVGVAQYGVYFPDEGTYTLIAKNKGQDLDWIRVTAVQPELLDFAGQVTVVTVRETCSRSRSTATQGLVLYSNESADVSVVPRAGGKPLLGMLNLTASVTGGARLDAPLVMPGGRAHQLIVHGSGAGSGDVVLTARDEYNDLEAKLTIAVRSDTQSVSCD